MNYTHTHCRFVLRLAFHFSYGKKLKSKQNETRIRHFHPKCVHSIVLEGARYSTVVPLAEWFSTIKKYIECVVKLTISFLQFWFTIKVWNSSKKDESASQRQDLCPLQACAVTAYSERVSQSVSEWVRQWVSEWDSEWVSEWVSQPASHLSKNNKLHIFSLKIKSCICRYLVLLVKDTWCLVRL